MISDASLARRKLVVMHDGILCMLQCLMRERPLSMSLQCWASWTAPRNRFGNNIKAKIAVV